MVKPIKNIIILIIIFLIVPRMVGAVNDVQVSDATNFELLTADTAALTTITAASGGQATNFDVQSNYIDIILDNLSALTFNTAVSGDYIQISKQSGSNDYTINPACAAATVTVTGTGATVVLRLQVVTTGACSVVPEVANKGSALLIKSPASFLIIIIASPRP